MLSHDVAMMAGGEVEGQLAAVRGWLLRGIRRGKSVVLGEVSI